jgi:hypothetical protein
VLDEVRLAFERGEELGDKHAERCFERVQTTLLALVEAESAETGI